MKKKYMVKFAWRSYDEIFGDILSFIVSPRIIISGGEKWGRTTYGYSYDKKYDEVFCFPANHPTVLAIIPRLVRLNSTQWSQPAFGEIVEEEFELGEFLEESIYQDNYERAVTFHTHLD